MLCAGTIGIPWCQNNENWLVLDQLGLVGVGTIGTPWCQNNENWLVLKQWGSFGVGKIIPFSIFIMIIDFKQSL